jgi:hypothetical protein
MAKPEAVEIPLILRLEGKFATKARTAETLDALLSEIEGGLGVVIYNKSTNSITVNDLRGKRIAAFTIPK